MPSDAHATGSRAAIQDALAKHADHPDVDRLWSMRSKITEDEFWGRAERLVKMLENGVTGRVIPDRAAKSLLKPRELATYLGFSVDTIYQMAQSGEIPVAFRHGPRLRFDLEAVLAAQKQAEEETQ